MIINIPPDITRDFILSHVSEHEIFAYYGQPVVNYPFTSPLRVDKHPTCSFVKGRNGKLYMVDWRGDFWGDCFDFVIEKLPYSANFNDALRRVASDFGLVETIEKPADLTRKPAEPEFEIEEGGISSIRVKRREWNIYDKRFWQRWDIKKKTLLHFNVAPVERVWLNNEPIYYYANQSNVAYCYHFGNYDYKIYIPYNEYLRFLHNNATILQGYDQLPQAGECLVITKSLKDVIKFYELEVPSVAPMSESMVVSPEQLEELKSRFDLIVALYDRDTTGIRSLKKYRDMGITPLWFPNTMPKDFTDFYEKFGLQETNILIETVKSQLQ